MSGILLGNIQFSRREIPETVTWGGKQMLHVHKQLGGQRVIDAMGPDPRPITWSGLFYGPSASTRARLVDALKDQGSQVSLSWGSFTYQVVVSEFHSEYKHEWEVRYRITCEVVSQGSGLPTPSLDQVVITDLASLAAITTLPASVTGSIATLTTAVAGLATSQQSGLIQDATLKAIQTLVAVSLQPLQAASTAQAAADTAMQGINLDALTTTSVQDGIAAFLAEQTNQAAGSDLATATSYLGRIYANLASYGG